MLAVLGGLGYRIIVLRGRKGKEREKGKGKGKGNKKRKGCVFPKLTDVGGFSRVS